MVKSNKINIKCYFAIHWPKIVQSFSAEYFLSSEIFELEKKKSCYLKALRVALKKNKFHDIRYLIFCRNLLINRDDLNFSFELLIIPVGKYGLFTILKGS